MGWVRVGLCRWGGGWCGVHYVLLVLCNGVGEGGCVGVRLGGLEWVWVGLVTWVWVFPVLGDGVGKDSCVGVGWVFVGVSYVLQLLSDGVSEERWNGVRWGGLEWVWVGAAVDVRVRCVLPVFGDGVGEVRVGGEGWYIGVLILAQLCVPRVSALGPRQLLWTIKNKKTTLILKCECKEDLQSIWIFVFQRNLGPHELWWWRFLWITSMHSSGMCTVHSSGWRRRSLSPFTETPLHTETPVDRVPLKGDPRRNMGPCTETPPRMNMGPGSQTGSAITETHHGQRNICENITLPQRLWAVTTKIFIA